MSWPAIVLRKFAKVPAAASVADFPGPYNILLYSLFPPNTNFMVAPLLVLQLKAPGDLQSRSTREASDRQIRTRMTNLSVRCPIPVLHGISAMGTRLCFYTKPRYDAILPQQIPANTGTMTDTAPPERWNCDLLEREGEKIKKACSVLAYHERRKK
ncbi:hypothetical protein F5887DRAFT_996703 [Amanita rubescens]|nr:hypothetical protein F5887DRAFT_996703 [Amanita rubescens]